MSSRKLMLLLLPGISGFSNGPLPPALLDPHGCIRTASSFKTFSLIESKVLPPTTIKIAKNSFEGMGHLEGERREIATTISRRNLVRRGILFAMGLKLGSTCDVWAYTIDRVEPDERETYQVAQKGSASGPTRILWLGVGDMKSAAREDLFVVGNEVIALDLLKPNPTDLSAARTYASQHGYSLRFEQGDATQLIFEDETFDAVVCSLFLCQDFDPEVVCSEIWRVLKPGGRFGFYEHIEDIDKVIVGKVFGERSVVRIQHLPENLNIIAGVVRKG